MHNLLGHMVCKHDCHTPHIYSTHSLICVSGCVHLRRCMRTCSTSSTAQIYARMNTFLLSTRKLTRKQHHISCFFIPLRVIGELQAAACQLEEKPRRMRTRQRPNSCEEASVRKRRQPTLLTTPAERHQDEERENEHGCNHLHAASIVLSEVCNWGANNGPMGWNSDTADAAGVSKPRAVASWASAPCHPAASRSLDAACTRRIWSPTRRKCDGGRVGGRV